MKYYVLMVFDKDRWIRQAEDHDHQLLKNIRLHLRDEGRRISDMRIVTCDSSSEEDIEEATKMFKKDFFKFEN